jgi:hypothetical protein
MKTVGQMQAFLGNGDQDVSADRNPNLRLDSVLGGSEKRLDPQVLLGLAHLKNNSTCQRWRYRSADACRQVARILFDFCHANLAYYKVPGYVWMTDVIPTTGTHKIQKHAIFPTNSDPRQLPGMIDLCHLKKRSK